LSFYLSALSPSLPKAKSNNSSFGYCLLNDLLIGRFDIFISTDNIALRLLKN